MAAAFGSARSAVPLRRHTTYPVLFQLARDLLGDSPDMRLLSFGCATGEEVFSLRRYFPQASIHGVDINPGNIAICRDRLRLIGDPGLSFAVAGAADDLANGEYDGVFAMAVFRHGDLNLSPPPPRCDHLIRFGDFERVVAGLARSLRPGGVLAIRHAQFRFTDTDLLAEFSVIPTPSSEISSPLYGRDNRLLDNPSPDPGLFRKAR